MTDPRPRLLDLFCGAGGAAMGYHRAGFEVVGVDIKPQKHYPFEFHQGDVMTYPLEGFDVIHASPPCQAYSRYKNAHKDLPSKYPDLIAAVREYLGGRLYVIENVPGSPLRGITLCGSVFGLPIRRHRIFETTINFLVPQCSHRWEPKYPASSDRKPMSRFTMEIGSWDLPLAQQKEGMGIDWMDLEELSEAIPPAYTEFIGKQLIQQL